MLTKEQKTYLSLKRVIDVSGAFFGFVILSPLLLMVSILTKVTSKGPILFRQARLGKNKKPFVLYKFRSMHMNAPQLGAEDLTPDQQKAMTTRWGEFIRKTSIDEIPQLFNILKGEMSFVGPRPCMAENSEELIVARDSFVPNAYEVKPGIGGYAQIHLHREHDPFLKARDDSYYVQNMSFWFDVKIFIYSFLCFFGFAKGR